MNPHLLNPSLIPLSATSRQLHNLTGVPNVPNRSGSGFEDHNQMIQQLGIMATALVNFLEHPREELQVLDKLKAVEENQQRLENVVEAKFD